MNIHSKIKKLREDNHWSQEDMAEKMSMSLNGYAKIERGETKLYLEKLEQIAQIFNIDVVDLMNTNEKAICFVIGENSSHLSSNYYASNEALTIEIEKLKLSLTHSQQLLEQKENEIQLLKDMIDLLKEYNK
ncbi:helix-turn-helix domain-containing protein [Avibacterium paragallinarum]|uniref:Transcriptional regulator/helix-turn-helix domain-containing protein n=1 Tax=Avibacterium paragallinarum TaxID=728 RepID=A0A377I8C6_AVIPA|nr:helix-turn-helix transcriptional regulator [Avibacterium paragallinarum]POY47484.1 XRE family transcriptional regulator [Avibacterium paragallinarum]RZN75651.1 XRE family transcriptional regulator [Avibacterium paragallinarum]CDF99460.1 Putative Transcriptional regulator/helix-turn-helix domain-containing protein [Avibacterium paragallinarum JF4211]STO71290.1 transcriptional regulator/helix-turn-helix domain-containing protein [Avibacterium paragallinarum]